MVTVVPDRRIVLFMLFFFIFICLIFMRVSSDVEGENDVEFVCVTNITAICSMPNPAKDIEFLSDGTHVIVAGTYRALWDIVDGTWEEIGLEQSPAVALDRANGRLAAASSANLRIYDLTISPPGQVRVIRDTPGSMEDTYDVVFGGDSATVFTVDDKIIYKWAFDGYGWRLVDSETVIDPAVIKGIWGLFYDTQRDLLVVMTNIGDCLVMDTALSPVSKWNNTDYNPPDQDCYPPYRTPFCFLNNWTVIWCGRFDPHYVLLNLSTGEYSSIPMELGLFHHISQSHDGKWLALVRHGQVSIYDSSTFVRLTWFLCSSYVTGIAWSYDDRYIATTDDSENLQVWVNIRHPGFNHPPNAKILSPDDGETVANTIRIAGNATDDNQVVSVLFKVDDGEWQFANGSKTWQFQWDTRFETNGLHRISVRAFDGEKFSAIAQVSLFVDNNDSMRKPPTVTIDEPLNNSIVSGTICVNGRAWGPNTIRYVRLSYSSYNLELGLTNGNWSAFVDTLEIPNGPLDVSALAFDGLWNSSPIRVTLTVQNNATVVNDPPTVRIREPESGGICSFDLVAKGDAIDKEGRLRFVLVRVDDGPWQSAILEGDEPREWTLGIDTWQLENGPHRLSAMCADDVQLSEVVVVSFIIDNDLDHPRGRPNIRVSAPANGSIVSGNVVVVGTADTEQLIQIIEYSVDGNDPLVADGKANWTFNIDTMALANGPCELRIWASGFVRDSIPVVLSLDVRNNRRPSCIITWPVNNQTFIEDFEIRGTAVDPEDVVPIVEVQLDGSQWQRCDGNLIWSYRLDIDNMTIGNHKVRARSSDGTQYSEIHEIVVQIYRPAEPVNPSSKEPNFSSIQVLVIVVIVATVVVTLGYGYRRRP